MTLPEEKAILRSRYLPLRDKVADEEKSQKILARLTSLAEWKNAEFICAYMPTRSETDVTPALQKALSENKKIALPKTETGKDKGIMTFRLVSSLDGLMRGRFGLLEPNDSCEKLADESLRQALCIVPTLAFDREGYRLGYGGGYYDRFLKNFNGISVGLVYGECLSDAPLPRGEFDVAVDVIISESEVIRINEQK